MRRGQHTGRSRATARAWTALFTSERYSRDAVSRWLKSRAVSQTLDWALVSSMRTASDSSSYKFNVSFRDLNHSWSFGRERWVNMRQISIFISVIQTVVKRSFMCIQVRCFGDTRSKRDFGNVNDVDFAAGARTYAIQFLHSMCYLF